MKLRIFQQANPDAHRRLPLTNAVTLAKAAIAGLMCAEAWYFSLAFRPLIIDSIVSKHAETLGLITALSLAFILIVFAIVRGGTVSIGRLIRSHRIDVFLAFCAGTALCIIHGGIGVKWYARLASHTSSSELYSALFTPFIFALILCVRALQLRWDRKSKSNDPFFLSDREIEGKSGDLLGLAARAERFAQLVVNQEATESIVFGIDAPWGIGKSSFVNFCREYWRNTYSDRLIIYNFDPLRYEDRSNLLEFFVDGLVRLIRKHYYIPELQPLVSRYSRFIKTAKASLFKLDLEVSNLTYTIDDAFGDLETILSTLDRKIIIVIDDLDRLSLSAVKDVLFAIKKSFMLPEISYVLCYDSENIDGLEKVKPDADKVIEFLEKFVNVKVGLYLDSASLADYVSRNLARALDGNGQADPEIIATAISGLKDIFESPDYHEYLPFIGDVRKLKRLINTLLMLEIDRADFDNSDFNKADLIHLLLIYINYPKLFRKIYNAETGGKNGFFSAIGPYDPNYPEYPVKKSGDDKEFKNSEQFVRYVWSLRSPQRFIVNRLFKLSVRLESTAISNVPTEVQRSYACFNGGHGLGRNLEAYLQLIVNLSKPLAKTQHQFYLNRRDDIARGTMIEEILSRDQFSPSQGEQTREYFWRVLVNSSTLFTTQPDVLKNAIGYLLHHIPDHSLLEYKDLLLGFRAKLAFFLIKLLDSIAVNDRVDPDGESTAPRPNEIGEWIFGESRHTGDGIIETLLKPDRGVLGFHDLLIFRLSCSADRGGSAFNLQRALSRRAGPQAPVSGLTTEIAKEGMREISQCTFKAFHDRYIQPQISIFDAVDTLTLRDLTGSYFSALRAIEPNDSEDIEKAVLAIKSQVLVFGIYQLGSSVVQTGVPCGYYDSTGNADKHGIRELINSYLFDFCFDGSIIPRRYEHFLEYLLMSFGSNLDSGSGFGYAPSITEFTKVALAERLIQYWITHQAAIKALNLDRRGKIVNTGNYSVSYAHAPSVYGVLDKLAAKPLTENLPGS
jgi:hypothetical protein